MEKNLTVWMCGPLGKMGSVLRETLADAPDITLTGFVSPEHAGETCDGLIMYATIDELAMNAENPDVIVDFTIAQACYSHALFAASHNVDFVTGTTGMNPDQVAEIEKAFNVSDAHAIIAPNFAVGVVLMMHYCAAAAKHFDHAEIIEIHHSQKKDAPSGTAISTARAMSENSSMTSDDIPIHSLRLPGAVAHQHVYLSSPGEVLRIEHDANDRRCFMPGILLAIRSVHSGPKILFSIEPLLFPEEQ